MNNIKIIENTEFTNNENENDHGRMITDYLESQYDKDDYNQYYQDHDNIITEDNDVPSPKTKAKKSARGFPSLEKTLIKTNNLSSEEIMTYLHVLTPEEKEKFLWAPRWCPQKKLKRDAKNKEYKKNKNKLRHSTRSEMATRIKPLVEKIENNHSIKMIQKLFFLSNLLPDKKFDGLYKLLHDKDLLLVAFSNICNNYGSSTPGVTSETVDGMSLNRLEEISNEIKNKTYKFSPFRRIMIEKLSKPGDNKNTPKKRRPLGIPEWKDRIVQEALRLILNAIYEPIFYREGKNFGFRPKLSCQHAVKYLDENGKGLHMALEGDIQGAYDNVNFDILLNILKQKITDKPLLELIKNSLHCGLMFKDHYQDTLLGVPQGSIVSPLFFNIYMHEFDKYVLNQLSEESNKLEKRNPKFSKKYRSNTDSKFKNYHTNEYQAYNRKLSQIRKDNRTYNSKQPVSVKHEVYFKNRKYILTSPKFKVKRKQYKLVKRQSLKIKPLDQLKSTTRIRYVRYADDWIILSNCHSNDLQIIKEKCKNFLKEKLELNLSEEKTKITNLHKDEAKFLGFTISCTPGFMQRSKDFAYSDRRTGKKLKLNAQKIKDMVTEGKKDLNIKRKLSNQYTTRSGSGHIKIGID